MKVKGSLSSSPPLLFHVAFLSFFQLENKKVNRGIGNKAKKKTESSKFLSCNIFEALQQNEKFQILKKIPMFFSAVSSSFSVSVVSLKKKKKKVPITCNRRGALLRFFYLFSNVCDSGNEVLYHLASGKAECSLPHLDCGGVGVCTWYLCWHPAGAVVKVCCVCLPAAGDGVLWCGLCH